MCILKLNSITLKEKWSRKRGSIGGDIAPNRYFLSSDYHTHSVSCEFNYCNQLTLLEGTHGEEMIEYSL
jgi:hypothetical protein